MGLVLGARFGGFGQATPIIVAEKVFTTEYGRYGSEIKSHVINIRHIEELFDAGMYTNVVNRIDEIIASGKLRDVKILADYTVAGGTAIEMLREKKIKVMPFLVTNGNTQTNNELGGYTVPVKDLITTVQRLLSERRLKFANLPGVNELATELSTEYRADTEYSDAVLNLCCVVWYANYYVHERKKGKEKQWRKAGRL